MQVVVTEDSVEVRLAWWQKMVGLMRSITVPRTDVSDVEVEPDPVGVAMRAGMKAGLRLPWLYFVARTIRLDQMFVVRRRVPALSFRVANQGALERVMVSTRDAEALAERLRAPAGA
jgi:hypothetical protein